MSCPLLPSPWPWMHAMDPIQSSPSLRAKSGWRTYHRLGRPLLKVPSSPFIGLSQQAIQILTDEGGFFSNLFHGRKSSGGTEAASGWSGKLGGGWVVHRKSKVL